MDNSTAAMLIHVSIKTYNRPHLLPLLLDDLHREAEHAGVDLEVHVFNDGSDLEYPNLSHRCSMYTLPHHGKPGFWKLVNTEFERAARNLDAERFLFLADDERLAPDFFTRIERVWAGIRDPKKIALNPVLERERAGMAQWTGFRPRLIDLGHDKVWHTQWVDCATYSEIVYLEELNFRVSPISGRRLKRRQSSGVGHQISIRLHNAGWNMYQVAESLAHHDSVTNGSVLHPEFRKHNPLTTR